MRELKDQLHSFVGQKLTVEGREIDAVQSLQWYPQECAYKLGTDRRTIRKLDALNDLHQWLIRHTDNGNITRQEAVSMVPPLALNVSPEHKCLDMCAAPGSKTSQLLEVVNRSLSGKRHRSHFTLLANMTEQLLLLLLLLRLLIMLIHRCGGTAAGTGRGQ